MEFSNGLCMGCMSEIGDEQICRICGYDNSAPDNGAGLPVRTVLGERYLVGRVLDSGGEGITYIGKDLQEGKTVRIREFFPTSICERNPDGSVHVEKEKAFSYNESLICFIELAKSLLSEAESKGVKMLLPIDCVVAKEFKNDTEFMTVPFDHIPDGYEGVDIGEKTRDLFSKIIREAGTVVWNGPFGVFEFDNFAHGSEAIALACAECKGTTIIGGGDSASAINKFGLSDKMDHISTGGGASLEFLEGKTLPGVACLMDRPERKKLIAGNWKMNMNRDEAKQLISELIPLVADAECDVVVCPPFVDLCCVAKKAQGSNIHIGSQNIHWAAKGAYTGEISADMLKNIGVEYAIIGHSERRQYFGETDESVNMRTVAALENGIIPIVCVGETLEQREAGITDTFLASQVEALYKGIDAEKAKNIVVAYEPIWAIGTGKTATDEEANRTIGAIRRVIAELYGIVFAQNTRILYGGSMNAKNAAGLKAMPEIDGGLIGGASLKAEDFSKVVHA